MYVLSRILSDPSELSVNCSADTEQLMAWKQKKKKLKTSTSCLLHIPLAILFDYFSASFLYPVCHTEEVG